MGRSRFFTETTNTRGKTVRTGNGNQFGRAVIGVEPGPSEEIYASDSVQITIAQTKDDTMLISISPRLLMRKYKVIIQNKNEPEVIYDRSK